MRRSGEMKRESVQFPHTARSIHDLPKPYGEDAETTDETCSVKWASVWVLVIEQQHVYFPVMPLFSKK